MESEDKPKKNNMETDLAGHTRHKKELRPPFATIPNIQFSSWKDRRMPEMLWAVLAIGNLTRDEALSFFRHVAKFVEQNPECHDITLSGISKLQTEKRIELLNHMVAWPKAKEILTPLLFFPSLPAVNEWQKILESKPTAEDSTNMAKGVDMVLWHQSQEATDCRWAKVLCLVVGKKMNFTSNMSESLIEILEYPNYGDMKHARPSIRASEIGFPMMDGKLDTTWADHFWSVCHSKTACIPETSVQEEKRYFGDCEDWDKQRKFYLDETLRVRVSMIEHYLDTTKTTAIDYRHEASFGLSFYVYFLFTEIILSRIDFSITGRLTLRSMVESYITLAYLLKKDDLTLWETYRRYGNGQAKLVYLKLQELKDKPPAIDEAIMREIANEDAWQEFTTINIGNWDTTTLREMSEATNLKDVYDQYYAWSSGFNHANWAAVREVAYERCINPLHRLHYHPQINYPKMPSVVSDAHKILNLTLALLGDAYPDFKDRIQIYRLAPITDPADKPEEDSAIT